MSPLPCSRLAACIIVGLACCVVSPAPCIAEEAVSLKSVGGPFGLFLAEATWCQRTIKLANRSQAPADVRIAYVAWEKDGTKRSFARTVVLPPKAERSVTLAVRPGILAVSGGKLKTYDRCYEQYVLSRAATGESLTSLEVDRAAKLPPSLTALSVIRGAERAVHDSDEYLLDLPSRPMGNVARLGSRLVDLPDRWYGYSLLDVVVLADLQAGELRPSQLQALLDWTRRGGILVLAGGGRLGELLDGQFARAAGVATAGVHTVAALQLAGPDGKRAPPVALKTPQPMAELCPDGARVLCRANGLPLLTHRPLGHGGVFVLAVPLGALADERVHEPLSLIGQAPNSMPSVNDDRFSQAGRQALNRMAGRKGPHQAVPFGILAVLAAVALMGGTLLRRRGRGELAWIVLVPLTAVVGVVVYVAGLVRTGPEQLSHVALMTGIDTNSARVQQIFAYYSGPKKRTLTLSAGGPKGVIWHLRRQAGIVPTLQARCGATMVLPDTLVEENSTCAFQIDTVMPAGGVRGALTFDESGVTGTLTNHLGADILDGVILVNRETFRLGRIASEGETFVSLGGKDRLGRGEFSGLVFRDQMDALRNRFLQQLAARPGLGRRISGKPVLIGWARISPLEPLGGREVRREGWCAIVWPLELAAPAAGTRLSIPAGFVDRRLDPNAAVWDPMTERFREHNLPAELVVRASPPDGIALKDAVARLNIDILARDCELTICGLSERSDGTRSGTVIRSLRGPDGSLPAVTIAGADRFRSQKDGSYVFSLQVQPADLPSGRKSGWKFVRIDIDLEGVSQ